VYDNYSFVLEWHELQEEFQFEKVDAYIERLYAERDGCGVEGLVDQESGEQIGAVDEWLDNQDLRECVEKSIEAHFLGQYLPWDSHRNTAGRRRRFPPGRPSIRGHSTWRTRPPPRPAWPERPPGPAFSTPPNLAGPALAGGSLEQVCPGFARWQ